jgi:outer membrane lipoprotein-sorting protein
MTEKLPNEDNLLEAAVQALRREAAGQEVPEDLLARVVAAGVPDAIDVARRKATGRFLPQRRWVPASLFKVAAAVLLTVLLWHLADRLEIFRASPAFADVVSGLRQTHSVFFKCTATIEGQKAFVTTCTLAEPGLLRLHASAPGNSILVFDEGRSSGLLLLPKEKKAIALTAAAGLPKETASMIAWYRSLRDAQNLAVADLGPRQLDGKPTFGFRVKKADQDFDVWVDRKTALPVQVETSRFIEDRKGHVVLNGFVFDVDVAPALFSLTPPPGYTVTAKTELAMPAEADLVYLLRTAATRNGGLFPDDLTPATLARIPDKNGGDKHDLAAALKLTNGLMFVHLRQKEGDWRYLGKGIKLGDAVRPVCAWRKTGESRYRAVFGDLRIGDLAAAEIQ